MNGKVLGLDIGVASVEQKKRRIGAHFFKLNTDKPYFNSLCCFEWFQHNYCIILIVFLQDIFKGEIYGKILLYWT
ncbi:hypothetical protein AALH12_01475 [Streptococcus ferus]|uniref:hypothetical protein n=1 Tax=Streptococcus ferus TaxID=1345 RepID=UPI0035117804